MPAAERASGAPLISKFGNLLMREILVVTSPYVRTPVRTDSGGGVRGVPKHPDGGGECHRFLAGDRAVLLGNQRSKTIVRRF